MNIDGVKYRTIRYCEANEWVEIIDQRWLPHQFSIAKLTSTEDVATAIREMWVRGAPLIGATAAYGMFFACKEAVAEGKGYEYIVAAAKKLSLTRPTAVNLDWAIGQQMSLLNKKNPESSLVLVLNNAHKIADNDADTCKRIGEVGLGIIRHIAKQKQGKPINVLTHCNAGWLACVDWGTATAPIYLAHDEGIPIHVWVDETRPRNQGARLTAWELGKHGVPHTVIPDNTGGHLMQHGMVDLCIVGTDRTTRTGDVANKIGTYLKALAAKDNDIPFYVALPSTTIDWNLRDGIREIPIEQRGGKEVKEVQGEHENEIKMVRITPKESPVANYGFDVTPSRLVTGLITERGCCAASEKGLLTLFPEQNGH